MSNGDAKVSIDKAQQNVTDLKQNLTDANAALGTSAPSVPTVIQTAAQFEAALAKAASGDTLLLAATFSYDKQPLFTRPVKLRSERVDVTRMTKTEAAPTFLAGMRLPDDVSVYGLAIRHTSPLTDIVVINGMRVNVDRCRVLGDPVTGGKRGVAANGGAMSIQRCFIADIKQPAQDTQAIGTWNMAPGLDIDDCYLEAAGMSFMAGGADPDSQDRIPSGINITNSDLTKNPLWLKDGSQIKNAIEFKNGKKIRVSKCRFAYAGTDMGQGAYLIVATPRNQGGKCSYCVVSDVIISDCTGQFAGGIATFLGNDDQNPSETLDGFTIKDCSFTDIDPKGITGGAGRLFTFDRLPKNITLDNLKVAGQNIAAFGYFSSKVIGLSMSRLSLPAKATYGWKINAGGMGHAALMAFMPDAKLDATVV